MTLFNLEWPSIPFLREQWMSGARFPAMILQTFLYGLYVVVFSSSIYLLLKRKTVRITLLLGVLAMFLIASADFGLTLFFFFRISLPGNISGSHYKLLNYKFVLYITNNALAINMFVVHCYKLWRSIWVVLPSAAILICGTITGYTSITMTSKMINKVLAASFASNAIASLTMAFLITGRMVWNTRKVHAMSNFTTLIKTFGMPILVESGSLYTLYLLLYLSLHPLVLDASLTQISGLVATTMIVQVARSHDVRDNNTTVTMMASNAHDGVVTGSIPHPLTTQLPALVRTSTSSTASLSSSDKVYR